MQPNQSNKLFIMNSIQPNGPNVIQSKWIKYNPTKWTNIKPTIQPIMHPINHPIIYPTINSIINAPIYLTMNPTTLFVNNDDIDNNYDELKNEIDNKYKNINCNINNNND